MNEKGVGKVEEERVEASSGTLSAPERAWGGSLGIGASADVQPDANARA